MTDAQRLTFTTVNISASDPRALLPAATWLGVKAEEPNWVLLKAPDGGVGLAFQTEPSYVRPTWPAGPTDQQMLEVRVDDLESAGTHTAAAPLLHALDAVAARLDGDAAAAVIFYLRDVAEVHRGYNTSSRRRPH